MMPPILLFSAPDSVSKLIDDSVDKLTLAAKLVIRQQADPERDKYQDYQQRIHGTFCSLGTTINGSTAASH